MVGGQYEPAHSVLCTVNIQQQQRGSAGVSRCASNQRCFPASPGGSRGVPRPPPRTDEVCNPSREFWLNPGDSSTLDVPGKNNQTRDHFSVVIKHYTNHQRQTRTQIYAARSQTTAADSKHVIDSVTSLRSHRNPQNKNNLSGRSFKADRAVGMTNTL